MSIAPLPEPRPQVAERPALRVLEGGRARATAPRGAAVHARREDPSALARSRRDHPTAVAPPALRRAGEVDVEARLRSLEAEVDRADARRMAVRSATKARRRRSTVAFGVLASIAVLALPLHALGAVTVSGQGTPGGAPAGLAPGTVYVVPQGATLRSIASLVNPSDATTIERELATTLGSSTVVPGEHVVIP